MRTALLVLLLSVSACPHKRDRDRIIAGPTTNAAFVDPTLQPTPMPHDEAPPPVASPDSHGLVP